jgi:hypothetical protein
MAGFHNCDGFGKKPKSCPGCRIEQLERELDRARDRLMVLEAQARMCGELFGELAARRKTA